MKAPFGPGDVVEKFKYCQSPNSVNVIDIGFKTIVNRFENPYHDEYPSFKSVGFPNRFCSCCFRLYEPPKPESMPTDTKVKAKA